MYLENRTSLIILLPTILNKSNKIIRCNLSSSCDIKTFLLSLGCVNEHNFNKCSPASLKDYLSDPSDVLKVQKKALLLGDKTWSTSSTPNKQSSTSDDDVPDGLEEKHLPIYQHS